MEHTESLLPVDAVTFEDAKKTLFARGDDVELEFALNETVAPSHLHDIRVYRHRFCDPADSVLELPFSLWLRNSETERFKITFNVDLLEPNGIYQACYVADGKILGRSALFRSPCSEATESDDGDELVVLRPCEVREQEMQGQNLEFQKSRCKHLLAHTEALHSVIRSTNSRLIEEKVYSKELQKTIRVLVGEKDKAADEIAMLQQELINSQASLKEKDDVIASLKNKATERENKLAALKSEMKLRVGILEEETLSLQRQVKESNERYRKLRDEYDLSQMHLENAKERLEAHESTKQLLHAELVTMKEFKARMSEKLVGLTTENEELRNAVEKLSFRAETADAVVEANAGTELSNEVNNNVMDNPAVLELQERVQELVDRLNAAAGEYTKLYKDNKRQERLLFRYRHMEKENNPVTFSCTSLITEPRKISLMDPSILQPELKPIRDLRLPLEDSNIQCGIVLDSTPVSSASTSSCKACPPTVPNFVASNPSSQCSGGARPKESSQHVGPTALLRDRIKGSVPPIPCGKWSILRRSGHVPQIPVTPGKRIRCSLKERRSSLPLLSTGLNRTSETRTLCVGKRPELTTLTQKAQDACGDAVPSPKGVTCEHLKDHSFVAIPMPELGSEDHPASDAM
ncbi:uncharacterized protein LOC135385562 isoform X2 [Ornithodoros turicata]